MTQGAAERPSPLAPFRVPAFRLLWFTWVIANMCMWMGDVAAAWVMTTLTTQPIWVALVQTAATLPIFLFGLPSGALADMLDRKRFLLVTQTLVAVLFACTAAAIFLDALTPALLLVLTLASGIGMAMRWPVFVAMVSESVPRPQMAAALSLNGLPMNGSRIFGPLLAGLLIASLGSGWVFAFNAVLSLLAVLIIARWPRPSGVRTGSPEGLLTAMRVGCQFVLHCDPLKGAMLRVTVFFLHSTALLALLPLLAQGLAGSGPHVFTLLLACMGVGAMVGIFSMAWLRQRMPRDVLLMRSTVAQAVAMGLMTVDNGLPLACAAMWLAGLSWISVVNTLSVSAQLSLPDWVRARGMSLFQVAVMGASASAAAIWGQMATWGSVPLALGASALLSVPAMWLANRFGAAHDPADPTPVRHAPSLPAAGPVPGASHAGRGPVVVVSHFEVSAAQQEAFLALMRRLRKSQLRRGARAWTLLHDATRSGRYSEVVEDVSWPAHERRLARMSSADVALLDELRPFRAEDSPPRVSWRIRP